MSMLNIDPETIKNIMENIDQSSIDEIKGDLPKENQGENNAAMSELMKMKDIVMGNGGCENLIKSAMQGQRMNIGGRNKNMLQKQLIEQMKDKGVDPEKLKKQIKNNKNNPGAVLKPKAPIGKTKKGVIITSSRIMKEKSISVTPTVENLKAVFGNADIVDSSCSILSCDKYADKEFKIWYDPDCKVINSRASKLVGFPVNGTLLIEMVDGNIVLNDLLSVEKALI